MALSANSNLNVRTGGNDANGGGFNAGGSSPGTDYSLQDGPQVTFDGATITASGSSAVITLSGYTVATTDNRNFLQISGGTNFTAGVYEIVSVNVGANQWTLDRNPTTGSASGMTGRMGGAFGTPGKLHSVMSGTADLKGNIKSGTYVLTTTTAGPGGPISLGNQGQRLEGYENTFGDKGAAPVLDAGALTSFTFLTTTAASINFVNIKVDGKGNSAVNGFSVSADSNAYKCYAANCAVGFGGDAQGAFTACTSDGCTTGFQSSQAIQACEAIGGTTGFTLPDNGTTTGCVARGCSGIGFSCGNNSQRVINCTARGCSGDGFDASGSNASFFACVATHNGGFGFDVVARTLMVNCAGFSNTSGNRDLTPDHDHGFQALSADPWTSSTDLRPNNTAGGGAVLRAYGIGPPQQTNNRDAGAVQHSDPAGGGTFLSRGLLTGGRL